jgi:hypothetical protein
MRVVFLALAFLAELAAWSALGVAAFVLAGGGWQGWVAAITTAAVVITVWGLVASPKAKAPAAAGLATKILVFGGAAVALVLIGHPGWAAALSGLIGVSIGGVRFTTPRPPAESEGGAASSAAAPSEKPDPPGTR